MDPTPSEIDKFIQAACAMNCAISDDAHEAELDQANASLTETPGLAKANIFAASVAGEVEAIRELLASDPTAARNKGGPRDWTPLLYLCFSRFFRDPRHPQKADQLVESARLLLDQGADPNTFFMLGDERETALYAAVGVSNHAPLARILLEHGAEVNDEDGSYHVAEFEDHECIQVLFDHGMDADRLATVLLRKLDFDDLPGVQFILSLGVDPNHKGTWGKTALHQAIRRGRDLDCIRYLLDHGADFDIKENTGLSCLSLAARNGRQEVVDELEKRGAVNDLAGTELFLAACGLADRKTAEEMIARDPNLVSNLSKEDRFVLTDAARPGNQKAIELMIDLGFDLKTSDGQGFTTLHWACWFGHLDLVAWLLTKGAPVDAKNNYGGTVLDSTVWGYANSNGDDRNCVAIIDALIEAGATTDEVTPFPSGHPASDEAIKRHAENR